MDCYILLEFLAFSHIVPLYAQCLDFNTNLWVHVVIANA